MFIQPAPVKQVKAGPPGNRIAKRIVRQQVGAMAELIRALREDLVDHPAVDIGQPEIATRVAIGQLFVINP